MNIYQVRLTFVFLVHYLFLHNVNGYKTFIATELCEDAPFTEITMRSLESNSSGILKGSRNGTFVGNISCQFLLKPPLSYGVVASVRLLDIPSGGVARNECDSYLQVYTNDETSTKLCGYSSDVLEFNSYESEGPMKLIFHTTNSSYSPRNTQHLQFQLTFTAFRRAKMWCPKEEFHCSNERCIWRGLTCDEHNNCGDLSDEGERAKCVRHMPMSETIAIVIGTVIGCVLLMSIIVCLRRYLAPNRFQRVSGRNIPSLRGRSLTDGYQNMVTAENPGINEVYPGTSRHDPPPKYEDIEHILRNTMNPSNEVFVVPIDDDRPQQ